MQHGKNLKWFISLEEDGNPTPAAYAKMPEVNETISDYWAAFWEITGSRPLYMGGMGEIPYTVVSDWLDENEIDHPQERRNFRAWIRMMDRIYMELAAEKNKRKQEAAKKK